MNNQNDKLVEVLLEELRLLRRDIKEDRIKIYRDMEELKKDIGTLKTRFMMVAITMGLAGGKLSAFLPFLK
jgi:hypothetical protein